MEHEISAATIANPLEEEEQEEGFIEGDDNLLSARPHDLAGRQPVLHVNTRRQEELGGGPVAAFARCRDQGCAACRAPDCGGLQQGGDLVAVHQRPLHRLHCRAIKSCPGPNELIYLFSRVLLAAIGAVLS